MATDHLYLDSDSRAALTEETAELYANTITVDNGAELALGLGQVDTHTMVLTDGGVLNVASRDYVLNSDLNNARYITNDKRSADYDYGVVAIHSDGHLAVTSQATIKSVSTTRPEQVPSLITKIKRLSVSMTITQIRRPALLPQTKPI